MVFEVFEPGVYLHGTKADLDIGEVLVAGRGALSVSWPIGSVIRQRSWR